VFEIALSFRAQKTAEVYDTAEMWDLRGWEQTPPHPCAVCDGGMGLAHLPSPSATAIIQAQPKRKMSWKDSTLGNFGPARVPRGRLSPSAGSRSSSRRPDGCRAPALGRFRSGCA